MRSKQDNKLKHRPLNRKLWPPAFHVSKFAGKIESCRRAIFEYIKLFSKRAGFVFLPQKQILRKFLILLLIFSWIFSSWPPIWNNPPFPPKIQQAQAASLISYIGNCTGTSSCSTTNNVGDLEIAYAGRDGSATAPTTATGWTSVGTKTINGTSSADSAVRMACKVTTGTNEASNTFTNAGRLVIHVYRNQGAGTTATCASAILGTPSFFATAINTTSVTETFNSVTNADAASWDAGFGYAPAATAGITTAPSGMTNRSSASTFMGGHDTNAAVASFSTANVTLTTAGRIITGVVEIKALVATTPSFSAGTGTYNNDQSITISGDAGDTFCYTTDGSTPAATTPGTCSTGSTYSSPVSITATATTLKAIATKAGTSNSAQQSATYTLTVGAITSSPGAGTYTSTQSVTLSIATTTSAVAHYTTDGSAVSCSSTTYSVAFNVSSTTTVKAIGCKTNYNSDTAISDLYTMNIAPTVTTQAAGSVEATTATGNGNITSIGSAAVTAWGVCYKISSPCTTADGTAAGSGAGGVGAFTASMTSLSSGTTYYIKAYAINSADTGYGSEVQILTKPAAPTGVAATDGTYTDKVTITWTKSTGATNYHVWRDAVDLGAAGDVATFDDTGAAAPTVTAGTASATDGTLTDKVTLSISGASANNGTTYTYKVVASNATGNSADSTTDTGYRGGGSLTYQWYRSSGDADSGYATLSGATTAPYDDTTASAPTITAGTATASDGTSISQVALSISGQSTTVGAAKYYYATVGATSGASSQDTNHDRGYIGVGSLTYQWQRSAADSDASYSNISGATTASYDDTGAPSDGSGRYFHALLDAAGAAQQTSTADRGFRALGSITADIVDASYVTISNPTTAMNSDTFSLTCQTVTGSFGTASQQIYVNNNNGANNGWTLTLAAQAATNVWNSTGPDYDFNDPTGSGCTDGGDADSVGGQMTVDPSVATLAVGQCGSCTTNNISKGSSAAFNQGTTDSITLLSAATASDDVGDWKLTGVSISQKIPAEQPSASDYNINMVLTVTAN